MVLNGFEIDYYRPPRNGMFSISYFLRGFSAGSGAAQSQSVASGARRPGNTRPDTRGMCAPALGDRGIAPALGAPATLCYYRMIVCYYQNFYGLRFYVIIVCVSVITRMPMYCDVVLLSYGFMLSSEFLWIASVVIIV